jgi:hypothetical protein
VVDKLVYFLIKRRLSKDGSQQPPLFPWETEVTDYPEENAVNDEDPSPNGHVKNEPPLHDTPGD